MVFCMYDVSTQQSFDFLLHTQTHIIDESKPNMNPFTFNVELYHHKMQKSSHGKGDDLLLNSFPHRLLQNSTSLQHPFLKLGKRVLHHNSSRKFAAVGAISIFTIVCVKRLLKIMRKTAEETESEPHKYAGDVRSEEEMLQSLRATDIADSNEETNIELENSEVKPMNGDDSSDSISLTICSVLKPSFPPKPKWPGIDHSGRCCSKGVEKEEKKVEDAYVSDGNEVGGTLCQEGIKPDDSILQNTDKVLHLSSIESDTMEHDRDEPSSLKSSTDGDNHRISDVSSDSLTLEATETGSSSSNHESRDGNCENAETADLNQSCHNNDLNAFQKCWIFNPDAPRPSFEEFLHDLRAFLDNGHTPGISDDDLQNLISPSKENQKSEKEDADVNRENVRGGRVQTKRDRRQKTRAANVKKSQKPNQLTVNEDNRNPMCSQGVIANSSEQKTKKRYRKRGRNCRKKQTPKSAMGNASR